MPNLFQHPFWNGVALPGKWTPKRVQGEPLRAKGGGLLLPGVPRILKSPRDSVARLPRRPLESPSVARWGPTALKLCNVCPLGRQLRGNSECLVVVGTCGYEPSRWSHADRQPGLYCTRRSCFAPISSSAKAVCQRCWWWRRRGTAPRVRNAYSTRHSTGIAGFPRRRSSRDWKRESQGFRPSSTGSGNRRATAVIPAWLTVSNEGIR